MKKKRLLRFFSLVMCKKKIWRIMQLNLIFILIFCLNVSASVYSQEKSITLELNNATLEEFIAELKEQTGLQFLYNSEKIKNVRNLNISVENKALDSVLQDVLSSNGLNYEYVDEVIVLISQDKAKQNLFEKIEIKGKIIDSEGQPLPLATIRVKGSTSGVTSDVEGNFKITVNNPNAILLISYVGYETKEIKIGDKTEFNIVLEESQSELEEVVVTGYSTIKKTSFTGNSVSLKKADILKVTTRNVVEALQVFDPSLRLVQNNELGSNPNALPEFYIRGQQGIGIKELDKQDLTRTSLESNPNLPVFIMDGFEISVEKLYDMDLNRIENITILKDAAATAVYGSRASNGVIVINTVAPKPGKLRVNYVNNTSIVVPDLSDYNLMNASQKLAAEVAAGLFEFNENSPFGSSPNTLTLEYLQKKSNIEKGVDINWLTVPLRNVVNHKHSLYIDGGTKDIRFGVDISYDSNGGVMKGSNRDRTGIGFYLDYRLKGLQIKNYVSYSIVSSNESPYGNFADYAKIQPYDEVYDQVTGQMLLELNRTTASRIILNPLYDVANSYDYEKSNYKEVLNNLSLVWSISDKLSLRGQGAASRKTFLGKKFIDPNSTKMRYNIGPLGSLNLDKTEEIRLSTNLVLSYLNTIKNHEINTTLGFNASETIRKATNEHYRGFPSGLFDSPNFAEEIAEKPRYTENHTRLAGFFSTLNYTYKRIYLLDASFRLDGSSEFGGNKRYAPFWSLGTGINLHNYKFMKNISWITNLKFRGSYGSTGQINFPRYAAAHTYQAIQDSYRTGFGIFLNQLGNENLKWQIKKTLDIGFDMTLWDGLINLKASYYNEKTTDLINDVTLALSTGFKSFKDNIGKSENTGFEVDFRANIIKKKDLVVSAFASLRHNRNRLLEISNSIKEYNDRVNQFYDEYDSFFISEVYSTPFTKYIEGGSLTAIWGMQSLGIDPVSGRELFLKKDGTVTFEWNARDQIIIGDYEPTFNGTFGFNITYKRFNVYTSFLYEIGGDKYNQTLVSKVENINIADYNADLRVLTDRWQQIGNKTPLKNIANSLYITRPTSRFLQRNNFVKLNSLSLSYDMGSNFCKKLKMSMCRLTFSMQDIFTFSTIKQERGIFYPFSRTFNFSVNLTF